MSGTEWATPLQLAAQMFSDQISLGVCESRCIEVSVRYPRQVPCTHGDAVLYLANVEHYGTHGRGALHEWDNPHLGEVAS